MKPDGFGKEQPSFNIVNWQNRMTNEKNVPDNKNHITWGLSTKLDKNCFAYTLDKKLSRYDFQEYLNKWMYIKTNRSLHDCEAHHSWEVKACWIRQLFRHFIWCGAIFLSGVHSKWIHFKSCLFLLILEGTTMGDFKDPVLLHNFFAWKH